jgi:hypothetical protein
MTTRVVHLKFEPYDVYIGRAGKGQDGYFGNPYRIGGYCERCELLLPKAEHAVRCFKHYFLERLQTDPSFKVAVLSLEGKALGCFCKPGPCHGDVIVEWLESL